MKQESTFTMTVKQAEYLRMLLDCEDSFDEESRHIGIEQSAELGKLIHIFESRLGRTIALESLTC